MDEKEQESLKRGYYASQVDKEFEKTFESFKNEDERHKYFEYCAMYSQSFGKMYQSQRCAKEGSGQVARSIKQTFYFMFLLAFPLNIPYTPLLFLIAALCSVFERGKVAGKNVGTNLVARIFTDEEPMNLALLLLFLFSTTFVKFFLYLCLLIFAFIMWSEWAFEMLEESRKPGGK